MPNNFAYNLGIPAAPNAPANDQPKMQTNTNAINSLLTIDHVPFNTNAGGIHKQVRMNSQGAPGTGDGTGCLYCDNVNSGSFGTNTWPVWQNSLGTFELITYPVLFPVSTNGIIPMAGKMIMQFGVATVAASSPTTVNMNQTWPLGNGYILQVTMQQPGGGIASNQVYEAVFNVGNNSFKLFTVNISAGTSFYWMAIGS